jgi:hypothetical protein
MARILALAIIFTGLLVSSFSAQAGINPFKKTKNYEFGNNIAWYLKESAAAKSGSAQDGSDTLYYHLNITKDRFRLRLGKNDPSGEIENTRDLGKMAIVDVILDGQRFSQFQRCLDNQEQISKKLKQNALVANGTCVNSGGGGDFTIRLDAGSRNALKAANSLELVIEPYGRPVKLKYSMAGFTGIMSKLDKPKPKPKPKPVAKVKAKAKAVAKVASKKKAVKMCLAKPPSDFKSAVRAVSYPCKNEARKEQAEKSVAALVEKEKQKMAAEMARLEQEEKAREKASKSNQIEAEWAKKQSAIWIKRCEKHWSKGVSPCFCEKYLDSAPAGVTNTCGN